MTDAILALRNRMRLKVQGGPNRMLHFGIKAIDDMLEGGLILTGLHEITAPVGATQSSAATLFTAGILARLPGQIVWCRSKADLFVPALRNAGLDAARILWVDAPDDRAVLACTEDSVRHGGAVAVVSEVTKLPAIAARRLQLASKENDCLCLILGRPRRGQKFQSSTVAQTRWRISPLPAPATSLAGMPRGRWQVELLRSRNGRTGVFNLEAYDATGHLTLPADLANRPLATEPGPRCAIG